MCFFWFLSFFLFVCVCMCFFSVFRIFCCAAVALQFGLAQFRFLFLLKLSLLFRFKLLHLIPLNSHLLSYPFCVLPLFWVRFVFNIYKFSVFSSFHLNSPQSRIDFGYSREKICFQFSLLFRSLLLLSFSLTLSLSVGTLRQCLFFGKISISKWSRLFEIKIPGKCINVLFFSLIGYIEIFQF